MGRQGKRIAVQMGHVKWLYGQGNVVTHRAYGDGAYRED
jgi:hypothetical protein